MTTRAEIRFAGNSDIEPICRLLDSVLVPLPFWRRILGYSWLSAEEKPHFGAVVEAGGEVVGFLGAMYSDRIINEQQQRFCNVFGWHVRPEYRHYSVPLLSFLVKRPDLTFLNVTPADHVIPIFKRMGFTLVDEERVICKPTLASFIRSSDSKLQWIPEGEVNEALLGKTDYRIFQDHFGHSVRRVVLTSGEETCLLIIKRMYWSQVRFPRTELYYASDKEFLARHFEKILPSLLRRTKTVALHADPSHLGFMPRGAQTVSATAMYPSAMLVRSDSVPPSAIDRLYSELVILP